MILWQTFLKKNQQMTKKHEKLSSIGKELIVALGSPGALPVSNRKLYIRIRKQVRTTLSSFENNVVSD